MPPAATFLAWASDQQSRPNLGWSGRCGVDEAHQAFRATSGLSEHDPHVEQTWAWFAMKLRVGGFDGSSLLTVLIRYGAHVPAIRLSRRTGRSSTTFSAAASQVSARASASRSPDDLPRSPSTVDGTPTAAGASPDLRRKPRLPSVPE